MLFRSEAFASKNPVVSSLADGLGMGLGFTLSLTVLAVIRELLAYGTIFNKNILGSGYQPFQVFGTPAGAFIALGLLMALMNVMAKKFRLE